MLQYTHVKKLTVFFKNLLYKSSYTHAHEGAVHADIVDIAPPCIERGPQVRILYSVQLYKNFTQFVYRLGRQPFKL